MGKNDENKKNFVVFKTGIEIVTMSWKDEALIESKKLQVVFFMCLVKVRNPDMAGIQVS